MCFILLGTKPSASRTIGLNKFQASFFYLREAGIHKGNLEFAWRIETLASVVRSSALKTMTLHFTSACFPFLTGLSSLRSSVRFNFAPICLFISHLICWACGDRYLITSRPCDSITRLQRWLTFFLSSLECLRTGNYVTWTVLFIDHKMKT